MQIDSTILDFAAALAVVVSERSVAGAAELLVAGVIELLDVGAAVELVEAHPVKARSATVVNPQIRFMILIQSPQHRPTSNDDLKPRCLWLLYDADVPHNV